MPQRTPGATSDTSSNGSTQVTLATAEAQVAQRSTLTPGHKTILAALELPEPPQFFDFTLHTD